MIFEWFTAVEILQLKVSVRFITSVSVRVMAGTTSRGGLGLARALTLS